MLLLVGDSITRAYSTEVNKRPESVADDRMEMKRNNYSMRHPSKEGLV